MGYIKLDRAIENWRYKQFPNYVALWVHILLKANYTDAQRKDVVIERGQLVTSIDKLSKETGLSTQQVRTALTNLNGQELTIKSTNKYTLITVNKYREYQYSECEDNKQTNKQITNKQQTNNKQITTSKEEEEIKKKKKINKYIEYGEYKHIKLTDEQHKKLIDDLGQTNVDTYIKKVDEYCQQHGKTYKDYNLTIRNWFRNDGGTVIDDKKSHYDYEAFD